MKFNPDDIIKLALANPGYGFKRFMGVLTGSTSRTRPHSQILRLFELHQKETGVNPYAVLQDTSNVQMVTMKRYTEVTGMNYPPVGFGLGSGGRTPKPKRKTDRNETTQKLVPLPPQEFNWLDVPVTGSIDFFSGQGQTNHLRLIDVGKYIQLQSVEMATDDQLAEVFGVSKNWILRFQTMLQDFDLEGVFEDWIRVYGLMYKIQEFRGKSHKNDELMADFRGIFRNYINDPISEEPPSNNDIVWVFNQLCEEEGAPVFNPEGEDHSDG